MRTDLLLKIADLLERLPEEKFDYGSWVGEDWGGKPDLSCGMTACALGWATTIPEVAALGLRLEKRACPWNPALELGMVAFGGAKTSEKFDPCESFRSATLAFDLTFAEAEYLFSPEEGPPDAPEYDDLEDAPDASAPPAEVAEHIRAFVAAAGRKILDEAEKAGEP
jgi:hypothetical protein